MVLLFQSARKPHSHPLVQLSLFICCIVQASGFVALQNIHQAYFRGLFTQGPLTDG
jgi:hypothetical protein